MITKPQDYYYTNKFGEYEFLIKVHYSPFFFINKRVRVGVTLMPSELITESRERSVTANHSEVDYTIHKLISGYLEEVGYFKIK